MFGGDIIGSSQEAWCHRTPEPKCGEKDKEWHKTGIVINGEASGSKAASGEIPQIIKGKIGVRWGVAEKYQDYPLGSGLGGSSNDNIVDKVRNDNITGGVLPEVEGGVAGGNLEGKGKHEHIEACVPPLANDGRECVNIVHANLLDLALSNQLPFVPIDSAGDVAFALEDASAANGLQTVRERLHGPVVRRSLKTPSQEKISVLTSTPEANPLCGLVNPQEYIVACLIQFGTKFDVGHGTVRRVQRIESSGGGTVDHTSGAEDGFHLVGRQEIGGSEHGIAEGAKRVPSEECDFDDVGFEGFEDFSTGFAMEQDGVTEVGVVVDEDYEVVTSVPGPRGVDDAQVSRTQFERVGRFGRLRGEGGTS
ncbi:hypothetical protein BDK51DRAFT_28260 [Blyttiomyces helicus]|uniref:Uncharacterized protein n=1 Tax=Blyttiomyces helicus TaxID=388810 RepID=A0A4P9WHM3_9FUNG|nr:hypothetical protein BDK51DRAFT_28260 [Blyttiomyces helicus]|eukprot:RKO92329.1 hypothetical protein BDK51DRAFT_28260 [Blyttiomyces helicus]